MAKPKEFQVHELMEETFVNEGKRDDDENEEDKQLFKCNCLVDSRDTCHRSLVNWWCEYQEEKQSLSFSSLTTQICIDFLNCTRQHCFPVFLPVERQKTKASNLQIAQTRSSNNPLPISHFVQSPHQYFKNCTDNELLQEPKTKSKHFDKPNNFNSTTSCTTNGRLFSRSRNKVNFNFQHFVDPEKIIEEYIRIYTYNKTIIGRVDKKKVSTSVLAVHGIQVGTDIDFNRNLNHPPNNNTSTQVNKSSTNAVKSKKYVPMFQFTERILATNNFTYDIGPIEDASCSKLGKNLQSTVDVNAGLCKAKSALSTIRPTVRKTSNAYRTHGSVTSLPKLNPINYLENSVQKQKGDFTGNTLLPEIEERDVSTIKKKLAGQLANERKPLPVEDFQVHRKVESTKSSWQTLRQKKYWPQSKDDVRNIHSRKLYEVLKNMTSQIERMQLYLDPGTNNDLRKGVTKTLESKSNVTFTEETNKTKDILFSKMNKQMGRKTVVMNDAHKRTEQNKKIDRNLFEINLKNLSKKEESSTDKGSFKMKVEREFDSNNQKSLMIDEASKVKFNDVSGSDRSLQTAHQLTTVKNGKEKGPRKDRNKKWEHSPFTVVADIPTMFDTRNDSSYVNVKKKYSPSKSDEHVSICENSKVRWIERRLQLEPETEFKEKAKTIGKVTSVNNDERQHCKETAKMGSCNASIQINGSMPVKRENIFVKMGLEETKAQIPKHLLTKILKSDYLRNNLSLDYL